MVITNGDAVVPASVLSNQFDPPLVEYWNLTTVAPFVAPAVNATDNCLSDGVIAEIVGAAAAPTGVAAVLAVAVPLRVFTARI